MNRDQQELYQSQLNRLLELNDELNRLRAAIAGGANVAANQSRVSEITAEAATIMDVAKAMLIPPQAIANPATVPTSGQLQDTLSGTPSEKELLRVALHNSTTAGVPYYASAAKLWNCDVRRGREICFLLGIDPEGRKGIRRALG